MDLNLETEGGVFHRRGAPEEALAVRLLRLPDFPDRDAADTADADEYDVRDVCNFVGFVELFYLWCFIHSAKEASMSRFELSATRLVTL
ncbi:hypothetical protein CBA19CS91_06990 [Paraburkholderia hospita]|jgi:hypothetical protein|nr:hypothetical protein CBA19CS91_06990 [Paraburkholderia hospita]